MPLSESRLMPQPEYAPALVVAAYLLSLGLPLDPAWTVGLPACAVVLTTLGTHRPFHWRQPAVVALGLFLLTGMASILYSPAPQRGLIISLSWLPGGLLLYVIGRSFDLQQLPRLYLALTGAGLMLAAGLTATALSLPRGNPGLWMQMAGSSYFVVPNDLIFLSLTTPFSLLLLFRDHPGVRLIAVAHLLAVPALIVLFHSRSAFLVLVVCIGLTLPALNLRHALIAVPLVLITALGVDALTGQGLMQKFSALRGTRIPLWMAAWQMFLDRPLLGQGPNSYGVVAETYLQRLSLPRSLLQDSRHTPWAHNLYLEVLAERGLLGMSAFVAMLIALGHGICRSIRRHCDAWAILAVLGGVLVAGLLELSLIRFWLVLLICLLIAIVQVQTEGDSRKGRPD